MATITRVCGRGRIEVEEVALPDPGQGEVRVRVQRCGICGSDLHWFRGEGPEPPVCPGHEISGIVEAAGAGAKGVVEGDRVAIEPIVRCGACDNCKRGDYHLCAMLSIPGITLPGGMASHLVVPDYCLFKLPEAVDFELGALTEPLAVTVHAARLGKVSEGSSVLVLGAGTVGLLTAAAARHLGASFVAITARHPQQKALAEALGCDQVLEPDDFGRIGREPDTVIETVGGAAPTVGHGMLAVKRGGTVVMVGLFQNTPEFNPVLMIIKEARLVGSMIYNRAAGKAADFDTALELLAARGDDLRRLITHTFALEQVQRGFETAADKSSGAIKVLLSPV